MANLNMARLSAYPVFLAVYEERRLVKAAERLCVTPSAVSHALRDFEQSLGTKLFERTSEGVQSTTAGQRLYAKVKPLVVGIEAAERELRSETAPEQTDFAFASMNCPHFARQIFDQSGVQACRTTASLYCLGER